MGEKLITPPTSLPLTDEELRNAIRYDGTDHDEQLAGLCAAAAEFVQRETGLQLMPATWRVTLPWFPGQPPPQTVGSIMHSPSWSGVGWNSGPIVLPVGPLISLESLTYIDSAGDTQEIDVDTLRIDDTPDHARISPAFGQSWPTTGADEAAVTLEFIAGHEEYEEDATYPQALKVVLRGLVAWWFEQPTPAIVGTISSDAPEGVRRILNQYKHPRM